MTCIERVDLHAVKIVVSLMRIHVCRGLTCCNLLPSRGAGPVQIEGMGFCYEFVCKMNNTCGTPFAGPVQVECTGSCLKFCQLSP